MPRHVDKAQRRRDILNAAVAVIADCGMSGLSFRAVADRLGGSTTLVTHYYPTQRDLVDDLAVSIVDTWDEEIAEREQGTEDRRERLMILLEWLVATDEQSLREQRARINLLADELTGTDHRKVFTAWDRKVRRLLLNHVKHLVPDDEVEGTIELLRVITNGVVLSAIEHPERWTRRRQLAIIERALNGLGIGTGS